MTQKTSTSPTRSRDKVLQSLYEIEVGGTSLKEVLKDQFTKKNYPHYKTLLEGVIESQEKIDELLENNMDRALSILFSKSSSIFSCDSITPSSRVL